MTADNGSFAHRRAQRALQRQLEYQQQKAQKLRGHEPQLISGMTQASAEVRAKMQQVRPLADGARVLEVGSGPHGLIFYFGSPNAIGVDPLAHHSRHCFRDGDERPRQSARAVHFQNPPCSPPRSPSTVARTLGGPIPGASASTWCSQLAMTTRSTRIALVMQRISGSCRSLNALLFPATHNALIFSRRIASPARFTVSKRAARTNLLQRVSTEHQPQTLAGLPIVYQD